MANNILLIVQARMESSRLPGKVLLPLCGQPMILWLLMRLARLPYPLCVAIPDTPANGPLADLCSTHGYTAHLIPGDPNDLLARFAAVLDLYPQAEHVVRVGGDTPLLDPLVVAGTVSAHLSTVWHDYTGLAKGWGDGIADCDVIRREMVLLAESEAHALHEREHINPFFWQQPQRFRCATYPCPFDLSWMRCSVDTHEDFVHVQSLLEQCLMRYGVDFGWREVWWTVQQDPALRDYMARMLMNSAYVAQVGSEQTWGALRYAP